MVQVYDKFYINGEWVTPEGSGMLDVENPATEETVAQIALGTAGDVDKAVKAAQAAFDGWAATPLEKRLEYVGAIVAGLADRKDDLAKAISDEMGAPMWLANAAQVPAGMGHFASVIEIAKNYKWEEVKGTTKIVKEPVGVCGFITPWNWPLNQIACKVAPALVAGCTMVLKPSEVAPLDAMILTEIIDSIGLPAGVFNLVNGDGPGVGAAMSAHPGIDMMSFTGSTRAGKEVAKAAAESIKRVTQELGGKSANIILPSADISAAVAGGVQSIMMNSGQSCNAPTRMLVPEDKQEEAVAVAKAAAEQVVPGDPKSEGMVMGPVVNETQWNKIQDLIQKGIDEGAELVCGGTGKPEGLNAGYYVKPTVFAGVSNDMTIAQEEIFGPVLAILPYKDVDDAVKIANETVYGLSGYVSGEASEAAGVATRLRTGNVHLNGAGPDFSAPFGGYRQSGNGREWGEYGLEEFLETKAILGAAAAE